MVSHRFAKPASEMACGFDSHPFRPMETNTGFKDLDSRFKEIEKDFLEKSRKRLHNENKISDKKLEILEKNYFSLNKDLLILSGTIFGSSIALATGKNVNCFFILGELFLFISIISGLIKQSVYLKGKEWDHAFFSKMNLDSFLLLNKDKIEKWELESTESSIKIYKKIIESNQKGFLYFILKKISIEKWQPIFIFNLILGILFILISIVPLSILDTTSIIQLKQNNIVSITPIPTDIFYVPLK